MQEEYNAAAAAAAYLWPLLLRSRPSSVTPTLFVTVMAVPRK